MLIISYSWQLFHVQQTEKNKTSAVYLYKETFSHLPFYSTIYDKFTIYEDGFHNLILFRYNSPYALVIYLTTFGQITISVQEAYVKTMNSEDQNMKNPPYTLSSSMIGTVHVFLLL